MEGKIAQFDNIEYIIFKSVLKILEGIGLSSGLFLYNNTN